MTNADDTVTLDVAYADSQGTGDERVTPTGMTETDVALITVADNPVAAGSTIELCYNEQGELITSKISTRRTCPTWAPSISIP